MEAGALCLTVDGVSGEASWAHGEGPVELQHAQTHACYLTGVAGRFEGGAEVLALTRSGSWFLSGESLQQELAGFARCVPVAPTSEAFGMQFDTASLLPAPVEQNGACYLTVLCGNLDARGDMVETAWNGSGWELRRQVARGRALRASAACFGSLEAAADPFSE